VLEVVGSLCLLLMALRLCGSAAERYEMNSAGCHRGLFPVDPVRGAQDMGRLM